MASLLRGNIVYAGPVNFAEINKFRSLGHFILEKLKLSSDRTLVIDGLTGQEYTGKVIYDASIQLARVLQSLGIKNGDVIGISSENRFEFIATLCATLAINATLAPMNVTYTEGEIQHAMNLSRPKIMFASKQTIERVVNVAQRTSFVEHIVLFDSTSSTSKIHSFKELMLNTKFDSKGDFIPTKANLREDVAFIVCSSGTTGLPKGVQLTQENIWIGVDSSQGDTLNSMSEATVLSPLPWFHVFGCLTLINAAVVGSKLVYFAKFMDHEFLKAIEKYRIKVALLVPPLMVFLAKHPKLGQYDLSSLEVLFCGAAPLSKETKDEIRKRLGVSIIESYGLSESTRGVTIQTERYCKPGSVGGLKKGVYAKVVDPVTGKTLGPNERGELCFKGCFIMKGYVGDNKATQDTIRDGWLHTGDIGYYDDELEFFVVDRIKELIKYKGFQVPPAEIEGVLLANTKIKDAAVIGKPDEAAGELPMAFVVKQDNTDLPEEEVIKYVAERVSPAKRLRGGVMFVDEIPKNPSGKILRRVLRDMLKKPPKSKL